MNPVDNYLYDRAVANGYTGTFEEWLEEHAPGHVPNPGGGGGGLTEAQVRAIALQVVEANPGITEAEAEEIAQRVVDANPGASPEEVGQIVSDYLTANPPSDTTLDGAKATLQTLPLSPYRQMAAKVRPEGITLVTNVTDYNPEMLTLTFTCVDEYGNTSPATTTMLEWGYWQRQLSEGLIQFTDSLYEVTEFQGANGWQQYAISFRGSIKSVTLGGTWASFVGLAGTHVLDADAGAEIVARVPRLYDMSDFTAYPPPVYGRPAVGTVVAWDGNGWGGIEGNAPVKHAGYVQGPGYTVGRFLDPNGATKFIYGGPIRVTGTGTIVGYPSGTVTKQPMVIVNIDVVLAQDTSGVWYTVRDLTTKWVDPAWQGAVSDFIPEVTNNMLTVRVYSGNSTPVYTQYPNWFYTTLEVKAV